MREHAGGGVALVPTAPEVPRNRDSYFPVPARQLFLLPVGLSGAGGGRRAGRWRRRRPPCAVLPRQERGARDLGRLPLRPRRGAGDLRLRRGAPDRGARREAARPRRRPARAVHAARLVRRLGPAGHRPPERGAQAACAPASPRRRRSSTSARRSTRCGSSRTRTSSTLMRRAAAISASGAPPRDGQRRGPAGTSTRSRPSSLHEFLRHGAQAVAYPSIVAGGPECLRAPLPRQQPADDGRRPAADRRRLRIPGLCVRHHAHVPGQRQVHRSAEGRLRARARRAAGVPRRGEARASSSTTTTRWPSACWRRASSTSACARARSTK